MWRTAVSGTERSAWESEAASAGPGGPAMTGAPNTGNQRRARVIMVDFAHTMPAPNNTTDANFLGGLRELIKHLKKVLEDGEAGRNSLNHAMDLSLKQTDSTS